MRTYVWIIRSEYFLLDLRVPLSAAAGATDPLGHSQQRLCVAVLTCILQARVGPGKDLACDRFPGV